MKNVPFEVYNPEQLGKKYTNLTMGPNIWGLLDPSAGILFSDKALGAVWVSTEVLLKSDQKLSKYYSIQKMFKAKGGLIMDNCPIDQIVPESQNSVRVDLKNGKTLISRSLVICAGPWTNKLLEPLK